MHKQIGRFRASWAVLVLLVLIFPCRKVCAQTATVKVLHNFLAPNGYALEGNLCVGPDGTLYGAAAAGGAYGHGDIFEVSTNGTVSTLYSFQGADGSAPFAGMTLGPDGNLYGTASAGGTNGGFGTVFKLTTNGALTTLVSYNQTNGSTPIAELVVGGDGNLYGTTTYGGTYDEGTFFKVTTNGQFTSLASFDGTNGGAPSGKMAVGTDGNFYGTTRITLFKATPTGVLTNEIALNGQGVPVGGLVANGTNGFLFATTGASTYGNIFNFITNGGPLHNRVRIAAVATFNGTNGSSPRSLMLGNDGNYYGTASYGGYNGLGCVFKLTNTNLTLFASFDTSEGISPIPNDLVVGKDGNFYGTTEDEGQFGGTVFKVGANGALGVVASFSPPLGVIPEADLTLGPNGDMYGTTLSGGTNGDFGTIFKITTNGVLTSLISFNGTTGNEPESPVTLGADGNFYGITTIGGANHFFGSTAGDFYEVTTNGILTPLASFNITNGAFPDGRLTLAPDGSFYGISAYGGPSATDLGNGVVYRATTDGAITSVYMLNSSNNISNVLPDRGVVFGPDGNLYGTTSGDGAGNGTIFCLTTNGTATILHTFNGDDGNEALPSLTLASDGSFYGTTYSGGTNGGYGTVYRVTTNGNFISLFSFNKTTGQTPGKLTLGSDGNFYGVTQSGGPGANSSSPGNGTVFRLTPQGQCTTVADFNGDNGALPNPLTLGSDGNLYGTTSSGGPGGLGTVFMLVFHPEIISIGDTNGLVTINVASLSHSTNRLWETHDLSVPAQWQVIATNVAGSDGKIQFTDSNTVDFQVKYYRVSMP